MAESIYFGVPEPGPDAIKRRRRRAFWRRFLFFGALIAVIGIAGYLGFARAYLGITNPLQAFGLLAEGGDYIVHRSDPPFNGRAHINILVLGADVSFEGSGAARTDTIKWVSVDLRKPSVAVMSIPRDTWVKIPGHREGRINGAYELGGKQEAERIDLTEDTITGLLYDLTGHTITFDYYLRIQTGGFIHIVDALGGVEVSVEKKMDYEDPSQELYIHLKPGLQRLNGEQAMGYVRFRNDAEGDYARIRRQDQFLRALVAQLSKPEERGRLPRLLGPIMGMLKTDIKKSDLLALKRIVDKIGFDGMYTTQLPTVPVYKGKASVVEVQDIDAAIQTVNDLLNGPRPTVIVLNGSSRFGLANDVKETVDETRYNVIALGTVREPVEATQVFSAARHQEFAGALAAQLGATVAAEGQTPPAGNFGKRVTLPPTADITVVLGKDYLAPVATSTQDDAGG
ncbi:MAG: LCP family protein [Armatimonadota bacterium]